MALVLIRIDADRVPGPRKAIVAPGRRQELEGVEHCNKQASLVQAHSTQLTVSLSSAAVE